MIINTNYRMGSFVDLCNCSPRCFPQCGCWQTSCVPIPQCIPSPECCYPNIPPQCNNTNNICLPKNALYFMAGYLISKKI